MSGVLGTNKRAISFDAFEVDLTARELHKRGVRLKLQDQPFQVLAEKLVGGGEQGTPGARRIAHAAAFSSRPSIRGRPL